MRGPCVVQTPRPTAEPLRGTSGSTRARGLQSATSQDACTRRRTTVTLGAISGRTRRYVPLGPGRRYVPLGAALRHTDPLSVHRSGAAFRVRGARVRLQVRAEELSGLSRCAARCTICFGKPSLLGPYRIFRADLKGLRWPVQRRHRAERNFACELCTYTAKTSGDLRAHVARHGRR